VTATFDLTFEKEYMQNGPVIFTPDSVEVKGPENKIVDLKFASLGVIKQDQLSQNFKVEKYFSENSVNRDLTFIPGSVSVSIPVEKYTEAESEVPVDIIGTDGLKVRLFRIRSRYFTMALKDYAKIEPGMIVAAADFQQRTYRKKTDYVVGKLPFFIRIDKTEPEKVEFIIIK
jgi:hypothetical protein